MKKRKTLRAGFVESQWKPFFDQIESSRLRRGKSAAKQGWSVSDWAIQDGVVRAFVKGNGFRAESWQVQVPTVDWWAPYIDEVGKWLSRRPDWYAAFLAQTWEPSFLEFVSTTGLRLFPDEKMALKMAEASVCTCSDWEKPCAHVAALVFAMVRNLEMEPLRAFEYVGIAKMDLLERVHAQSVRDAQVETPLTEPEQGEVDSVRLWPEEKAVLAEEDDASVDTLKHRIRPQRNPSYLETWKKTYMAWE